MVLLHCCAARGLTLKKDEEVSGGRNVLQVKVKNIWKTVQKMELWDTTVFPRTAQFVVSR